MTGTDPENRLIGYVHVSTYGQTLDAQIAQLRAEGGTLTEHSNFTHVRANSPWRSPHCGYRGRVNLRPSLGRHFRVRVETIGWKKRYLGRCPGMSRTITNGKRRIFGRWHQPQQLGG